MGWTNSHLHQFKKKETYYQERTDDSEFWNENEDVDYKNTKISGLLKNEKEKIIYEYDFGDGWEHDIIRNCKSPISKDKWLTEPEMIVRIGILFQVR